MDNKDKLTQVCKICNVEKPLSEFYKDGVRNGFTHYRGDCKVCYKESRDRMVVYKRKQSNQNKSNKKRKGVD